jgi:TonB family protein
MNRRDLRAAVPAAACSDKPSAWVDELARGLIRHAARRSPPLLTERLEEEWLADLATRLGPVARLQLALGCCWATRVITHEHAAVGVAAAATGHRSVAVYMQRDAAFVSRRTPALLLIAGLHVALIYFLATGFVHTVAKAIPDSIKARILEAPQTPPPPPLPPGPQIKVGPLEIPDEGPISLLPVPDAISVTAVVGPQLPPSPSVAVNRVWGGPGKGFPATADFYPAEAIRAGQSGVATVRVCVDANGHLTADPALAESSGSARLDKGAMRLAKAGSGYYRPTTEDGRRVNSCYSFRARFDLRN